jgi:predicted DNA-binding protein
MSTPTHQKNPQAAPRRPLFVRLPAEQVERLRERAAQDARTLSATVRLAVEAYLGGQQR